MESNWSPSWPAEYHRFTQLELTEDSTTFKPLTGTLQHQIDPHKPFNTSSYWSKDSPVCSFYPASMATVFGLKRIKEIKLMLRCLLSRTILVAMAHGKPTVLDMADTPFESPYAQSPMFRKTRVLSGQVNSIWWRISKTSRSPFSKNTIGKRKNFKQNRC